MKRKLSDDWQMLSTSAKIDFIMTTAFIVGLIVFLIFAITSTARASSVCLTKSEARELWPRQHIYWYSKHHCWSNRRGPPRGIKLDPVKPKALASQAKQEQDYCCWPKLPRDAEGNIIEPPPSFSERWEQVRDVFRGVWKRITE